MKSINFKIVAASMIAAMLIIGLVVVGASVASGGSAAAAPTAQNAAAQAAATPGTSTTQPQPDAYYNLYLQNLATNLGVSQGKLTSSMTQAAKDTIAQAVKDGKLTQAQADSLNQRIDQMAQNGQYGFQGIGRGHGFGGPGFGGPGDGAPISSTTMSKVQVAVAARLGLTTDQLTADFQSGQSLATLATSKNVALADLKTIIINTIKPDLDAAVKAGTMTQAQEDSFVQRIQNDTFTHPGLGFAGPGFGGHGPGGHGFGGPDNDNGNGSNNTSHAPAATPGSGNTN